MPKHKSDPIRQYFQYDTVTNKSRCLCLVNSEVEHAEDEDEPTKRVCGFEMTVGSK